MSFILDALKKSERQRPPGQVPDLFTVHGPQLSTPRRLTRAIVAGALLLAVPAIALLVWIGADRRDESVDRPPAAASAPQPAESPAAPVTPRTAASTPPLPAHRPAAAVAVVRKSVGERPRAPAPPAQTSPEAASSAPAPLMLPAEPPSVSAPAAASVDLPVAFIPLMPAPVESESTAIPPPEMLPAGIPVPDAVTSPEPLPADSAAAEAPPADGRVLELAELPAVVLAEIPKLLVSGHVWSEEPSMRLLSVDDQLLREGGEAAPGVNLQEITPEGAVFVYKGWRFRVGGGRP